MTMPRIQAMVEAGDFRDLSTLMTAKKARM
jgi:hypothetical protein